MARKRHTAEEIVTKLRRVDVLMPQGRPVAEAIRAIAVTEVTYYRWRNEYDELQGDAGQQDDLNQTSDLVKACDFVGPPPVIGR
jgi:hypothetical protein